MPLVSEISGNISQECGTSDVYLQSSDKLDVIVNILNNSNECIMIASLRDKEGKVITWVNIKPGQKKSLVSKGVFSLIILCSGSPTEICIGNYSGEVSLC